jgi:ferredoxin
MGERLTDGSMQDVGKITHSTGAWICPSTKAFLEEARQATDYSFFDLVHGYFYARWPYLYIGVGTGGHWLSKPLAWISRVIGSLAPARGETQQARPSFADGYHGKVVPLRQAKRLVTIDQDIRLTDLEQVIPFDRARDIILKNPQHIVVIECPCRSSRVEPCLPLDVCLIVGEPFAGFVLEHHPRRSRSISPAEAEQILADEHARGHVHHAFFKDAMLGRFYAICNCCPCCCGAMQAMRNGTPMLISSGYISRVDEMLCIGCAECEDTCPFEALTVEHGVAVIDAGRCMGCGVCVDQCDQGALTLVLDGDKPAPLEIETLINAG